MRFVILFSVLFSFPAFAGARAPLSEPASEQTAMMSINIVKQTRSNITADIIVDPGQAVNAVGAYLNFSSDKLRATRIITTGSFCSLFIENEFNNASGTIKLSCGRPYPGISKSAQVFRVVFDKLAKGKAEIRFTDDTQVLANDGYGTDVLLSANDIKMILK